MPSQNEIVLRDQGGDEIVHFHGLQTFRIINPKDDGDLRGWDHRDIDDQGRWVYMLNLQSPTGE